MITNQEKQSEEHKKWVEFLQQLIEDLKSITDEDILELLNNENISQDKEDSVYWNCSSKKFTTEPVIGKTYFILKTQVTPAMQEFQERYEDYETVKYKFFSDFHSVRKQLKEDLKRMVLSDLSKIDFESEKIPGHPLENYRFVYLECFSQGYFPLHFFSYESFKKFILKEIDYSQGYSYFYNNYFRRDYDSEYIDGLIDIKMKPIYKKMFPDSEKFKFPISDKVEYVF